MGQQSSLISNRLRIDHDDWIEEPFHSIDDDQSDVGIFKVYKNISTEELIDCYEVNFSSGEDFKKYIESFQWRLNQENVVNTKYIQPKIKSQLCSSTFSATVYIQHPAARLSDFKDIPSPDNLYCLEAMLSGFGKIYSEIGRFPITQDQVIIDLKGKVRVWLNADLSRNYPSQFYIEFKHQTPEQMEELMVEQIVKLVDVNTDSISEPEVRFIQYFERQKLKTKVGFQQAKEIIHRYNKKYNLNMKDYFESVLQIYNYESSRQNEDAVYELPQHPVVPFSNTSSVKYSSNNISSNNAISIPFIQQNSIKNSFPAHRVISVSSSQTPSNKIIDNSMDISSKIIKLCYKSQNMNYTPTLNGNEMRTVPTFGYNLKSQGFINNQVESYKQVIKHNQSQKQNIFNISQKHEKSQCESYQNSVLENSKENVEQFLPLDTPVTYEKKQQKQFYYTIQEQVELDPQIAADLLLYI